MNKKSLNKRLIAEEWFAPIEPFEKWVLHVIKNEAKCKIKLLNNIEFLGVPYTLKNGHIAFHVLDTHKFETEKTVVCEINQLKSIETIEKQLLKYHVLKNPK